VVDLALRVSVSLDLGVVGSVAFDSIETPFDKIDKVIGGAATYIAYSATNFNNAVQLVSVIGDDYPQDVVKDLEGRNVNTDGLQLKEGEKSFHWSGKYHNDMNQRDTLATDLNVLETFDPILPASYKNAEFVMLGNLAPMVQKQVLDQMNERPKLVVMDTMNFWMDILMEPLKETISMVDVLVINDEEARQLSGEYSLLKASKVIMAMGPKYLIIKKGEHGALLFDGTNIFSAPALPLEDVFDPTGAGDTFAGGFIGYLAQSGDISFENMKRAVIYGSALASFCCEKFGPQRLQEITAEDMNNRVDEFVSLMSIDIKVEA
jgi:sugar/nucleoside kinase (ribokinase family)